mmetsp:Transcript_152688/g.284424  ORF Transcript_152688/g.284424 Transcript_152688/m.284424 type:complete len:849 (-) Transcript_152688:159-2705(-)
MHRILLALVCLHVSGQGEHVQTWRKGPRSHRVAEAQGLLKEVVTISTSPSSKRVSAKPKFKPSKALAAVFIIFNPTAAFVPAAPFVTFKPRDPRVHYPAKHLRLPVLDGQFHPSQQRRSNEIQMLSALPMGILALFLAVRISRRLLSDVLSQQMHGVYARDLTKLAAQKKLDPVIGRDSEMGRTIEVLARRKKNNPVLIGDPGVGKTAIAEGLAQSINDGDVPDFLEGKRVVELDLAALVANTQYRGQFEQKLKRLLDSVAEEGLILMIDELHMIVGAGSSRDRPMDAANILKPRLVSGELQVIGATTLDEYRKYIEKDKALERRFQPITVAEPTVEEAAHILKNLAVKYEEHHQVRYTPEAIEACVKCADKYIRDRFLPDKAIDVLDQAGARVGIQSKLQVKRQKNELTRRQKEKDERTKKALDCSQRLKKIQQRQKEVYEGLPFFFSYQDISDLKRRELKEKTRISRNVERVLIAETSNETAIPAAVTEADVSRVVAEMTRIPAENISAADTTRLLALEHTLHRRIVGQEEAISAVAKALNRASVGLRNPDRPIASLFFSGPTGVGKTELCKVLAEAHFGRKEAMICLDMSEFDSRHTVAKLIGSPPGYVGYDDESQLCDRIRRNPYSLVLFDEIEKAHPDVFNIMLQILEDGMLTDSKGRTVSFKNALIIMTSNVGAQGIQKTIAGGGGFGFQASDEDAEKVSYDRLKSTVMEQLKNNFKPEFINRLDETIVFQPLTKKEIEQIAELEFAKVGKRIAGQGITLEMTEAFKKKVVEEGFDPTFGARPLRRAIGKWLEDELAGEFLSKPIVEGEIAIIDLDSDGKVVVLRDADGDDKSVRDEAPVAN